MAEAKESPDEMSGKLPSKVQHTSKTRDEVIHRIEKDRDHRNRKDSKSDSTFRKTSESEKKAKEQTCKSNKGKAPRSRPPENRPRSINSSSTKNNEKIAIVREKKHKTVSAKSDPQLPQMESSVHKASSLRDEPSTFKTEVKNSPPKKKMFYAYHRPERKRSAKEQEKVKQQKECSNTHLPGTEEAKLKSASSKAAKSEVLKSKKEIPTSKKAKSQQPKDHSKRSSDSTDNIESGTSKAKGKDRVCIKVKEKQTVLQMRCARAKPPIKVTRPGVAQEGQSNVEKMRTKPESKTANVPQTKKAQEEKAVSQILDEKAAVTSSITQPAVTQERQSSVEQMRTLPESETANVQQTGKAQEEKAVSQLLDKRAVQTSIITQPGVAHAQERKNVTSMRDECAAKNNVDKVKSESNRKKSKTARKQKKIKDAPLAVLPESLSLISDGKKTELKRESVAVLEKRDEIKKEKTRRYRSNKINQTMNQESQPPENFRQIQICPTLEEITTTETPFLRPNIKKGSYDNLEHYLDVQFRLFREDFVAPLREGIQEVTENIPVEERIHKVKLYHGVEIVSKQYTKSGITHEIKFDVSRFRQTNWSASKRLTYGSFLCISKDNFKSMLFATIADREPSMLKRGRVQIAFIEGQCITGIEKRKEQFIAAESPAFFEAYRHVLLGLQSLNVEKNLPFQKYLVECKPEVDPPKYLCIGNGKKPVYFNFDKLLGTSKELEEGNSRYSSLGKEKRRKVKEKRRLTQKNQVPVLQTDAWPALDRFALNESQLEALKTALTTEFSVIQGPPGTGKTYIGLRIVETLLDNQDVWNSDKSSPMLMVCYTNHALDQFLEGVLEFLPKGIIRVGGRSKSEKLERFNLKKFTRYGACAPIYNDIENQIKTIFSLKKLAEHVESDLLKFKDIEPFVTDDLKDKLYFCRPRAYAGDMAKLFDVWLCSKEPETNAPGNYEEDEYGDVDDDEEEDEEEEKEEEEEDAEEEEEKEGKLEEEEKNKKDEDEDEELEKEEEEKEGKLEKEKEWEKEEVVVVEEEEEEEEEEETIDIEQEADRIGQERCLEGDENAFQPILVEDKLLALHKENDNYQEANQSNEKEQKQPQLKVTKQNQIKLEVTAAEQNKVSSLIKQGLMAFTTEEVAKIQNMWELSEEGRVKLYMFWVRCYKNHWRKKLEKEEEKYQNLVVKLKDAREIVEMRALSDAVVIGMTTTGAARYHKILQEINPKIVVIEEAAEVLEAHILTSLTQGTEHTILIGDHKQLRPKPTVYKLAQDYNLEISLFERMVLNKMDCKQLSTQHRMRPNIARLTKRIYDNEIFDHESVCSFEDVRGLEKNLFFIDHREPEKLVQGLQSHSNQHEASFVVSLTKYLLNQDYDKSKITVLTMYSAQLLELKGKMPKREFDGVQVSVVDNFQGEENDIIILSLVRSSKNGRIGFLKEDNRICVALSRARKGFFCIGNFDLLSRKCETWRNIVQDLKTENEIGEELRLKCSKHGNVVVVKQGEDFKKTPLGGCGKACGEILDCGHLCRLLCHGYDINHTKYVCEEKCPESCPQGHPCFSRHCHYGNACPPCKVEAIKQCLKCGEAVETTCGCQLENLKCMRPCNENLSCNHKCERYCYECYKGCDQTKCKRMVIKTLPCKHLKEMCCGKNPNGVECQEGCERLLECGHQCPGKCYQDCMTLKCYENVLQLRECGHEKLVKCFKKDLLDECKSPCKKTFSCGHECPGMCYEDCSKVLCKVSVDVQLQCGHMQQQLCHERDPSQRCHVLMQVTLPGCNHNIEIECWKNGAHLKCPNPCSNIRTCNHSCRGTCGVPCELTPCKEIIEKRLPCGHYKTVPCYMAVSDVVCDSLEVTQLPGCDHKKHLPCYQAAEVLSGRLVVKCDVLVLKDLPCGHTSELPCSQNIDAVICNMPCERMLSCGIHQCQDICGADCSKTKCDAKVMKELQCRERHRELVPCYLSVKQIICKKKCQRKLECGHPCTQICGNSCSFSQCQVICARILSCPMNHQKNLPCYVDSSKYVCQENCNRTMECGHPCKGPCGVKCDISKCGFLIEKTLPCGHKSLVPCGIQPENWRCHKRMLKLLPCNHWEQSLCSKPVDAIFCTNKCDAKLPCGHKCLGICGKCRRNIFHKVCHFPCSRILVCSHPCQAKCGEPCPPCNRRCESACPHRRCEKRCGEPCERCEKPCENSCPHSRCNRLCYELCDKTPCEEPCTIRLPCGHPCPGLCGEFCPSCIVCNTSAIDKTLRKNMSDTKFIQLFDCGHVVDVQKMDQIMEFPSASSYQNETPSPLLMKNCPKCSTTIRFSYRYERLVKQYTAAVNKIKLHTFEILKKAEKEICGLLSDNPYCREKSHVMQFPVAITLNGYGRMPSLKATARGKTFFPMMRNHLHVLRLVFQDLKLLEEISLTGENRDTYDLLQCFSLLYFYLKEVEARLMFPMLQEKTIRAVQNNVVKLTLLCHILLAEVETLGSLTSLHPLEEDVIRIVLNQAVKHACGVKRTGMYSFLKKLDISRLRKTLEIVERAPSSIHTTIPDFISFPGLSRDVWFTCKNDHVFFINCLAMQHAETVRCPHCTQVLY